MAAIATADTFVDSRDELRRAIEPGELPPEPAPGVHTFYREVIQALLDAKIPFLIGGGYAMRQLTGIVRSSPDLDVFVLPGDTAAIERALSAAGYAVEVTFKHWLLKVRRGERYIDLIYNSGNGATPVDAAWFEHSVAGTMFDLPVRLCPPEEMIWSKAFVVERERCDVADVAHLIRAVGAQLDWQRLIERFDANWRVLFAHVVLFGFVYPGEADLVPAWIIEEMSGRLLREHARPQGRHERLCRGTLLSREQYLVAIRDWGYRDARLQPDGGMRPSDVDRWTAAIPKRG